MVFHFSSEVIAHVGELKINQSVKRLVRIDPN